MGNLEQAKTTAAAEVPNAETPASVTHLLLGAFGFCQLTPGSFMAIYHYTNDQRINYTIFAWQILVLPILKPEVYG